MASADDRKETSLRACVAYMLGIDASEVPTKREANLGQWLALRNLGLVPVASNRNLGRYLHRNVWQHPSSRLQGTLGHDTVSFHGLSVRPRTHDEKSENPVKRAERRPEGRYRTFTPVGVTP